MKSVSHANNIVLRRVIYIHSLPGLKLVKRFSLANETWCAVTVPPFDFVKGDCVVGNAVLGKKGYKRSTEYKIYSRKSTNLTVVGLSCKTKGKIWADKKRSNGCFRRYTWCCRRFILQQKKSFGVLQFLACADTLKLPYVTKDETTCYFIQFSIKAMVCKAEFYFTHSV